MSDEDLPEHIHYREDADIWRCERCGTDHFNAEKAVLCCPGGEDQNPDADELDPYRVLVDGIDDGMKRCSWVNWEIQGENGKVPKVPGDPQKFAKSNDATTWRSFDEALDTAEGRDLGIGLPFAQATPFVALDIDVPGAGEWVPDLGRLGGAVVERSPSNNFRVYLRDVDVPEWWTNQGEHGDETREVKIFEDSGYVTVTGDTLDGHGPPIGETSDAAFRTWLKEAWRAFNDDEEPEPWETTGGEADPTPQSRGKDAGNHPPAGHSSGNLGIYDVISRSEYPPGERRPHPFHGSSTGKNFKVDDDGEAWRCFSGDHNTGGYAIDLVGMEAGLMNCDDKFGDLTPARQREIYDAARERGYDVGDPSGGPTPRESGESGSGGATTDGGTAAASASAGGPAGDEISGTRLTPAGVMAAAGLGEDDSISDLTDREKAYWVWYLIDGGTDHHLLAAVPEGQDNPESVVYRYDGGLWVPAGEQLLRTLGADALGPQYSENVRRELVEQVRARGAKPRDALEAEAGAVAVQNGLLTLDTREVRDLRPDDYALRRLGAEFDPEADCPRWREFLNDVVREGDVPALQEYVGYCLMHWQMPYKRAALLLGPQDSGKSTFLNVVKVLLGGSDNVSSENLNSLVNTRWGTANLQGRLANITNELETVPLETLATFKTITGGGDLLTAERKGKDPFQFEPVAKHMFAANRVPPAKDADGAFHKRWLHVRFPETIPDHEQIPQLDDRLEDELPGILNWALDGLERLTERDEFTADPDVERKRELWEAYGHSVKRFKHNCLDVTGDSDDVIVKSIGHDFYAVFCEEWAGTEVESQSKFTRELTNDSKIGQGRRTVREGDKQRTVYTGVKFSPTALERLEFDPGAAFDALRDDTDDDPDDQQGSLGGYDDE